MQSNLIIKGKYILPMTTDLPVINNGAVVINKSNIIAIGKEKELENKYRAKEVIDTGNSIVMPGLINTHTHTAMTYFRGLVDDLPLQEWLEKHIWPAEAKYFKSNFVKKASELACLEMIKSGITCFNNMSFFEDKTVEAAESAGLRLMIGEAILNFPTPSCETPHHAISKTLKYINTFKNNELVKIAFALHAIYTCERDILIQTKQLSKEHHLPLHIHISETRKEVEEANKKYGKSPVAYLEEIGFLEENVIAAHSVWLDDNDLEIYKRRGVKVSHNPISNMKLASGIAPAAEMIDRGIIVGLGTDGAASNNTLDLFSDMRICALLHKVNKLEPTATNAREVVKMATINGAKVLGLSEKVGSLEAGKRADIITINLDKPHLVPIYDPYSHLVYCVNGEDVINVIINGQVIMRNREVKTIDEEKVLEEARKFKIKK